MFNLRGRNRNCEHLTTTATANYGLVRTVCSDCGVVHIEDMGTAVTETMPNMAVDDIEVALLETADDQSLASTG